MLSATALSIWLEAPCSHEADTRNFVHARHVTEAGIKVIMVKASDADFVIITVNVLQLLQELGLQQLWVAFDQGQNLRSSTAEGVDGARLDMFARRQIKYEAIPPTRAALKHHVKCAAYQTGCIRSQSTVSQPETQTPADWGWIKKEDLWQIV
ncbi:hypothetical protein Pcinc_003270 [Petrolisthes cinctipes]|uniref:Uncharacterized protein n=1 Tax=Petrolisthes cinctipes TaxID=88211 RepID=A0AAE1GH09_PETCI|nr:hypothetical protein Pcinc_003270 [Petrolisthes cinctipes]